jgi:hypothetical protein
MNEQDKNTACVERKYEPPKVLRVSLRPEEAVLGHCKLPGTAGPASSGCGGVIHCHSFGS